MKSWHFANFNTNFSTRNLLIQSKVNEVHILVKIKSNNLFRFKFVTMTSHLRVSSSHTACANCAQLQLYKQPKNEREELILPPIGV